MSKKVLSMLLALMMLLSTAAVCAEPEQQDITVYLSVSKYGDIVQGKQGEDMACVPVDLSGKASYNLDDVFSAAHETYYADGAEGYASSQSEWGLGVDKLWGDTSYNFGYQVNGGRTSVMGLEHTVEQGDYIDVCIYQNLYPDTESYARFETFGEAGYTEEPLSLTLSYVSGYDESWNSVFSPCEGATILVNGEETQWSTDENGQVQISFPDAGTYIISAQKSKTLQGQIVPAITAPACVVDVQTHPAVSIIHNIAEMYAESDFEEAGGNLPWILADMAAYEMLFPDSAYCLTPEKKQEGLESVIVYAIEATRPGDLAKAILALRALGYDAGKVYTRDFTSADVIGKLTALVDSGDEAVTNIYTLPYVIIALAQWNDAHASRIQGLVQAALESKEVWQDVTEGTDAMTPMILALAPYCDADAAVEAAVAESVEILQAKQREDGLIDGFPGYESASTGLAICALSAAGIDVSGVKNGEKSLIDGLLSVANEDQNGFPNAFATEQGLRGLLAWRLLVENTGKTMYDFSDFPMEEANISGVVHCPVMFDVTPKSASVTIDGETEVFEHIFDLDEGVYKYTVSASGYRTESGTIEVTAEDKENRTAKTETVSLSKRRTNSGGGSGGAGSTSAPKPQETEQPEPETTVSAAEAFSDIEQDSWYYPAVQYAYQNKLLNGTDKGFEPHVSMTRGMLVTVLHRLAAPEETYEKTAFTDVSEQAWYAKGVAWASALGLVQGMSDTAFAPDDNITREQLAVILYRYALSGGYPADAAGDILSYHDADRISGYASQAMQYVVGAGILLGDAEQRLHPGAKATRAEVATMLMRFMEAIRSEK